MIWHEDGYHKGKNGVLGMPLEIKGGGTTELPPVDLELPKPN